MKEIKSSDPKESYHLKSHVKFFLSRIISDSSFLIFLGYLFQSKFSVQISEVRLPQITAEICENL